ncbi:hypothetical protein BX600DRAFT_22348 [Xylariales sp. PMI_506]|nr:hypothetical protein BX600DRAFT_22348 [Xylariales sp. PMI_506]
MGHAQTIIRLRTGDALYSAAAPASTGQDGPNKSLATYTTPKVYLHYTSQRPPLFLLPPSIHLLGTANASDLHYPLSHSRRLFSHFTSASQLPDRPGINHTVAILPPVSSATTERHRIPPKCRATETTISWYVTDNGLLYLHLHLRIPVAISYAQRSQDPVGGSIAA